MGRKTRPFLNRLGGWNESLVREDAKSRKHSLYLNQQRTLLFFNRNSPALRA